jgi:hypothetical protein
MIFFSKKFSKFIHCRPCNLTLSRSYHFEKGIKSGGTKHGKYSESINGIQWVRDDPTAISEKCDSKQQRHEQTRSYGDFKNVRKWVRREPSPDIEKRQEHIEKRQEQSPGPVVEIGNYYTRKPMDVSKTYDADIRRAGILKTSDRKFETQLEIDDFIRFDLQKCYNTNIADLMRISCKAARKNRNGYLNKHLPLIASRLGVLSSSAWSFRDISAVIYGLQCIEGETYIELAS